MKKMIAEVIETPNQTLMYDYTLVDVDGSIDKPVTQTLMEFVLMADNHLKEIESLLDSNAIGQSSSEWPYMPDWGMNDINLWLNSPFGSNGYLCITNENTEYNSEEGGLPQVFSYEQFHAAVEHWQNFRAIVAKNGGKTVLGHKYEAPWPINRVCDQ